MSDLLRLLLVAGTLSLAAAIIAYIYGKKRSEARLRKHRRYLADISHELRTPLTVIESYASMIKRWAGSDPKLREEAADVILSEASRLRRMTAQLLSRFLHGEAETDDVVAPFDLDAQLRETAKRLEASFGRTIRVNRDMRELRVAGSEEQLQQLWIIVLDNALKYSSDAIDINLEETINSVIVTIHDRGIGIPVNDLPRLFDRNYRCKAARHRSDGSGIGLSLADEIVKRHDGDIRFESEPGRGTTVIVTLPRYSI